MGSVLGCKQLQTNATTCQNLQTSAFWIAAEEGGLCKFKNCIYLPISATSHCSKATQGIHSSDSICYKLRDSATSRFYKILSRYKNLQHCWHWMVFPWENPISSQRVFPMGTQKVFLKEKSKKHVMCFLDVFYL